MDIDEFYEKYMPCSRDIIGKIGTPAFLSQDSNNVLFKNKLKIANVVQIEDD